MIQTSQNLICILFYKKSPPQDFTRRSSVSWPWWSSSYNACWNVFDKSILLQLHPQQYDFLGYEVFIQAEQIRVICTSFLPFKMSTYFRLPLQCMRNVLTSPKKEIPNNIVALSQILHLTSNALNFVRNTVVIQYYVYYKI